MFGARADMKQYHSRVAGVSHKVRRFFSRTFDAVKIEGPELDIGMLNESPLMIPCTHRSHIDYFVLGKTIFDLGIEGMRFAAGDNLTRLPVIGRKFRNFGAFTISRGKVLERNYIRQLCDEVVGMLDDKDKIIVFPEGGRSYNGKMSEIKLGILGAAVIAQSHDLSRPVYLLPSAVSYEIVPEVAYFKWLLKGKELRKHRGIRKLKGQAFYFGSDLYAFAKVIASSKFGRTFGTVYIDYDPPVAVRDIVDLEGLADRSARHELSIHRKAIQGIADAMRQKFFSLFRLLPVHVLSHAIIEGNADGKDAAQAQVAVLIEQMRQKGRNVKTLLQLSAAAVVDAGVSQLGRNRALACKGDAFKVKDRSVLAYYAAALQ
jgi:1-acyl-sn-glycerol-3-phosphate acyltransferase